MIKLFISLIVFSFFVTSCSNKLKTDSSANQNSNAQQVPVEPADSNTSTKNGLRATTTMKIGSYEVPDRVFFSFNESELSEVAQQDLDLQAKALNEVKSANIVVEGYCDERGGREYNLALGEKRAASVKRYLLSKGVETNKVTTISYGKEKSLVLGTGEQVWAQNRAGKSVVK